MNILNKKTGFTLMELMIVVLVISVLAAAGVPYYRDHIERQKTALGVTNLRMIADSVERYMALHSETVPTNLALLDADIDRSKLSADHTSYDDGNFTFSVQDNAVVGVRNTGEYKISFSLDDNSELSCEGITDRDICTDKLGFSD